MSLRQYNLSVNISIVPPPPFPPLHMHGITMSFNYIQKTKQNEYLVIKRTHYVSRGFSCCRCVITHLVCLQCSHLTPPQRQFSRELRTFWNLEIGSCRQRLRDNITGCSNMEFLFFILFFFKLESQRNVYIKNEANRLTGHCPKY